MGFFSSFNPFNPIDPVGIIDDPIDKTPIGNLPSAVGLLGIPGFSAQQPQQERGGFQLYPSSKIIGGKLGKWADSANAKYNDVMTKQQALNEAVSSGDKDRIEKAARDYETAGKEAVRDLGGNVKKTIRKNRGLSGYAMTEKLTGSNRAAKFLDPAGDVAVNDIAEGRNVFQSLQRTMGANQRDITDTFGELGTLFGEGDNPDGFFGGLKGWGENLSSAEKRNLGAQSTALQQVKSGNVSDGWKTGYEGQREFFNDRNVQAAIAVAATMGAAWAMAPYLASTLGISNGAAMALANGITSGAVQTTQTGDIGHGLRAGVASGLGGYAASYVPNLGNAALTGAARGAVSSGVSQLAQTGKIDEQRLASAAVGGGISSGLAPYGRGVSGLASGAAVGAINGGSEGAQSGAISGLLTGYGQEYGGNTGRAVGGLLAGRINQKNRPQVNQRPQQIMRPQTVQRQAGQGYNPQQMQQLYAQYMAQKRG